MSGLPNVQEQKVNSIVCLNSYYHSFPDAGEMYKSASPNICRSVNLSRLTVRSSIGILTDATTSVLSPSHVFRKHDTPFWEDCLFILSVSRTSPLSLLKAASNCAIAF